MRGIAKKITAVLASGACIVSGMSAVLAASYSTTVKANKTGTLTIDYKDDSEGKKAVSGAQFTLYKIGKMIMPVTGGLSDAPAVVIGNDGTSKIEEADTDEQLDSDTDDQLEDTADQLDTADQTDTTESDSADDNKSSETTTAETAKVETYFKALIPGVPADSTLKPVKVESKVRNAYKAGVKDGKQYKMTTNFSGKAKLKGIEQGLYLAVETKPAKEHFASIPFAVSIPQMVYRNDGKKQGWCFNVIAYPKSLPAGDLKIKKTVTGNAGEKNRTFHFNVNFDLSKASSTLGGKSSAQRYTDKYASGEAPDGYHVAESDIKSKKYGRTYDRAKKTYSYTTSDGRKGKIGTKGTISLKSGQTATIKCIPIGTAYKVTEQEANKNRYKTTVKNEEGRIRQHKVQTVSFINRRVRIPKKSSPGNKTVGRVKTGDNFRMAGYIAAFIAASAGIILAVRRMRRRRKEGR